MVDWIVGALGLLLAILVLITSIVVVFKTIGIILVSSAVGLFLLGLIYLTLYIQARLNEDN